MAETISTRVTRLEGILAELAEKVKILFDAQIRTEKRLEETNDRIEKLVTAIGMLIPPDGGRGRR